MIDPAKTSLVFLQGDEVPYTINLPAARVAQALAAEGDFIALPWLAWEDDVPGSGTLDTAWQRRARIESVRPTGPGIRRRMFDAFDQVEG